MLAAGLIVLAAVAVFSNSFAGPFVFDGRGFIEQNPAIRTLWPPWAPMVNTNRPVGLWSFALNYAVGGLNVWGYHAANLAIHLAAALTLFGIIRCTLARGRLASQFGPAACWLALAAALLWLVHPLQTQSVTYVYQRYESLMGLWFLLTVYCFIRGAEGDSPIFADVKMGTVPAAFWYVGSVICCLLAIGTKEVAVVTPLLVLWYDRALVASSWRKMLRRRWGYYAALARRGQCSVR